MVGKLIQLDGVNNMRKRTKTLKLAKRMIRYKDVD